MKHHERHPTPVPGCFGCHVLSVQIGLGDSSSNARHVEITERERRWERDMPAYKRLRMQGLQPPRIDGCGDLEARAANEAELTTGRIYETKAERQTFASVMSDLKR